MTYDSPVPSIPVVYARGGTSKALYFHLKDLPPPGRTRDDLLIRLMGSPDPSQIDGMGGAKIVTSKIAILSPSDRDDADVTYTFCQVGLGDSSIDYDANCGNISSGVGPFAINEGLLKTQNFDDEGKRIVRIYNTGMDCILVAHVPINPKTNRALELGDYEIDGCPGTGAPILMDYSRTAKASTMLPTGHVIDVLDCSFGKVDATFCDVGNPIVFVEAAKLGIAGNEGVSAIDSNTQLINRVREVRGRMAQLLGKCQHWEKVDEESPMLPMVALISKPTAKDGNIQSRLFLDNHVHPTMAGTGGICTTTVSRIPGSIVNRLLAPGSLESKTLNIQHPAGFLPIQVSATAAKSGQLPKFDRLGFIRTARYLMQGNLFIPADIQEELSKAKVTSSSSSVKDKATAASKAQDDQAVNHPAQDFKTEEPVKVTEALVAFTEKTTFADLTPEVLERLRQCLLDFYGVASLGALIGESSAHFVKGVETMTAGSTGKTTVIGLNKQLPIEYAALLNGAFAHTLDFDDTHTQGVIHVAATVVATLVTEAQQHSNLTYKDMMVAMAVGYEVAIRISLALSISAWHRGFHPTSIAGIYGAVAVICKLRKLDTQTTTNAFGLAVSFASGSMQYLSNGSWNKRLHPAKAAHDAFLIIAMAQASVLGAAEPIEGNFGLVKAHTDKPFTAVKVDGLGKRWDLVDTGLKPYPACRVTHTSIELAKILSRGEAPKVKSIKIIMDPGPYPMVADPTPAKIHPKDTVDAQFSAYYQAAATWLYGDELGWGIYDHINDAAVQDLCGKITIESKTLDKNNDLVTTMIATLENGEVRQQTLEWPKWQQPQRPPTYDEVTRKFRSLTVKTLGQDKSKSVMDFVAGSWDQPATQFLKLLPN